LGSPAEIAISRNNLANHLRLLGRLDEAEEQTRQALEIFERLSHPETWKPLWILEMIAEARGDTAAAADYRRRKQAARAEAEERAGTPTLPPEHVTALLQVAVAARRDGIALEQALAAGGAPDDFLAKLDDRYPWLVAHLRALAGGAARPIDAVPGPYRDVVDAAWRDVPQP
jgi:tetratricopeptide (TPR) repeat protein